MQLMPFRESLEEELLSHDTHETGDSSSTLPKPHLDRLGSAATDFSAVKYNIEYENETLFIDSTDWRESHLLKCQIITSYVYFIIFGMADQTVGALIPKFQEHYKVNDIMTSYLFLATVCGYMIAAVLSLATHKLIGVKGVLMAGGLFMITGYSMISLKPPFFLLVGFYLFNGIALGALDAGINTWMGGLKDSNPIMGILHGCYGIGCMISPPLITYLLSRKKNQWHWNQYYYLLALLSVLSLAAVALTFRYETAKKYKYQTVMKVAARANIDGPLEMLDLEDGNSVKEDTPQESASFSETVKSKMVWTFAIVLFIYVGGESAFGAWLISFMMRIKNLSYKKSSYMATSFWTGLTVGRICLGFVTEIFFSNELIANLVYIGGSFGGMFLFWLLAFTNWIPLLFLVVFLTGVAIGPIFPTTIVASLSILPVKYHTGGVGFICAFGGGGGAAIPFLIGLIAESSTTGLRALPLVICMLYGLLLVVWAIIAKMYHHTG